ncbi:helix-turn-helix domain-containing protein [Amycolatopsis pigmentata]|uniref:Helix-turn-helix domain-containing protein n=1 Tax=Amycolatopsis pigmentata TaxID=450801 RepID=A0ABW5FLL5_9PSEU
MGTLNPTAIKRWIALEMRRHRETAGIDRAAAAERIGKASTVIAHIETARNLPAPSDVEVLLQFYGQPELVASFRELIKKARRGKDWWIKFHDAVPESFNLYLGLETGAARISSVDLTVLPALFQTREYASAILRPPGQRLSNEEIESRIELRLARQAAVLDRGEDAPQIWSVIDEGILRRRTGGPAVMRAQLEHLARLSERPNIEIQVLPFSAGAHPATDGPFTILDYPTEFVGDPGTVCIENRRQVLYYESMESLNDFRRTFERLQIQAEHPDRSREMILSMAKEIS